MTKKKKNRNKRARPSLQNPSLQIVESEGRDPAQPTPKPECVELPDSSAVDSLGERAPYRTVRIIAATVLGLVCIWAYLPTLFLLVDAWNSQPDYSHGFLVPVLSILFLWVRRESFPGFSSALAWPGLLLIAGSILLRVAGAVAYIDPVDGWSLILWIAGTVWLVTGWQTFKWSLPSIAFLIFMIPLPYRVERMLSLPLQEIATNISCGALVCLGQPALAEGNTILLGDHMLEVEDACSGLRIFVGIIALAFAYVIVFRRSWWEKLLLLGSTLPIAVIANSIRIVVTGLLWQNVSGELAHKFSHDMAGWFMIPLAAAMFGGVLWYLDRLFPVVERATMRTVVQAGEKSTTSQTAENRSDSHLSVSKG